MQDWPVTAVNYQAAIASTLGVSAAAAAVIAAQYPLSAFPSPPLLGELRRAGLPILGRPAVVAGLRQPLPADDLTGTAAAPGGDELRRGAPLRVLGSRRIARAARFETRDSRAVPAIQAGATRSADLASYGLRSGPMKQAHSAHQDRQKMPVRGAAVAG